MAPDATGLAKKIVKAGTAEVVFFCGDKRRDALPSLLTSSGITVHEFVLYETVETPQLVMQPYDAVLFFSPSAVHSFFLLNRLQEHVVCFAVGETTAKSIKEFTSNRIVISSAPSQEKMVDAVVEYFGEHTGAKEV